ncbi:MAG: hypothetical protein EPN70_22230 [Paraburkholderia sp.]|uniref:hypothetical protein n=1 Tax=Paraburkholderia sp. TaxID=1926495 RepID=UPI0012118028|nr:hypothetical protein [Paraburkholderia sp.]TAM00442.1 MAG: hypothetical protein EPN70_22230 [Paraburkholderia sp.]TAM31160.1 MAG: hypothetical protein EPN59_05590 [Paraburkholderia sp.]
MITWRLRNQHPLRIICRAAIFNVRGFSHCFACDAIKRFVFDAAQVQSFADQYDLYDRMYAHACATITSVSNERLAPLDANTDDVRALASRAQAKRIARPKEPVNAFAPATTASASRSTADGPEAPIEMNSRMREQGSSRGRHERQDAP